MAFDFPTWVRENGALDERPLPACEDAAMEASSSASKSNDATKDRVVLPTLLQPGTTRPAPVGPATERQAARLTELEGAEDDVLRMLTLASECSSQLGAGLECDAKTVVAAADEYNSLARRVHATLSRHGRTRAPYAPYQRSSGVVSARVFAARQEELAMEELRRLEANAAERARSHPTEAAAVAEVGNRSRTAPADEEGCDDYSGR